MDLKIEGFSQFSPDKKVDKAEMAQSSSHIGDEITKNKLIPVTAAMTDDDVEKGVSEKKKYIKARGLFLPQLKTIGLL